MAPTLKPEGKVGMSMALSWRQGRGLPSVKEKKRFGGSQVRTRKEVDHKTRPPCDRAALASRQSQREPVGFDASTLATKNEGQLCFAIHHDGSLVASPRGQREPVDAVAKTSALKKRRTAKPRLTVTVPLSPRVKVNTEPTDFDASMRAP